MQTLTTTNFEHFSLGGVETLTIKILKQKFFGRMGGPLKLKFANPFIIYQKCPFRGQIFACQVTLRARGHLRISDYVSKFMKTLLLIVLDCSE